MPSILVGLVLTAFHWILSTAWENAVASGQGSRILIERGMNRLHLGILINVARHERWVRQKNSGELPHNMFKAERVIQLASAVTLGANYHLLSAQRIALRLYQDLFRP